MMDSWRLGGAQTAASPEPCILLPPPPGEEDGEGEGSEDHEHVHGV